jgi:hypothetical protein
VPDSLLVGIADEALRWRDVTPAGFIAGMVIALLWIYHRFILIPFAKFLLKRGNDG